jgi:hypothetical protein
VNLVENTVGGYAFIPGLPFASQGVVALPGMAIEHATLFEPITLPDGLDAIRRFLEACGRPLAATCGLELRMPKALSLGDFVSLNVGYLSQLDSLGLARDAASPLARTNVVPVASAPESVVLAAFSYTMPSERTGRTFVVSGVAEVPEGATDPKEVVRAGETSFDALVEKANFVVDEVSARIGVLGTTWDSAAIVNLYSAHDLAFLFKRELLSKRNIVPSGGLTWHDTKPPVLGLELEVDVRRYSQETMIANG